MEADASNDVNNLQQVTQSTVSVEEHDEEGQMEEEYDEGGEAAGEVQHPALEQVVEEEEEVIPVEDQRGNEQTNNGISVVPKGGSASGKGRKGRKRSSNRTSKFKAAWNSWTSFVILAWP